MKYIIAGPADSDFYSGWSDFYIKDPIWLGNLEKGNLEFKYNFGNLARVDTLTPAMTEITKTAIDKISTALQEIDFTGSTEADVVSNIIGCITDSVDMVRSTGTFNIPDAAELTNSSILQLYVSCISGRTNSKYFSFSQLLGFRFFDLRSSVPVVLQLAADLYGKKYQHYQLATFTNSSKLKSFDLHMGPRQGRIDLIAPEGLTQIELDTLEAKIRSFEICLRLYVSKTGDDVQEFISTVRKENEVPEELLSRSWTTETAHITEFPSYKITENAVIDLLRAKGVKCPLRYLGQCTSPAFKNSGAYNIAPRN